MRPPVAPGEPDHRVRRTERTPVRNATRVEVRLGESWARLLENRARRAGARIGCDELELVESALAIREVQLVARRAPTHVLPYRVRAQPAARRVHRLLRRPIHAGALLRGDIKDPEIVLRDH